MPDGFDGAPQAQAVPRPAPGRVRATDGAHRLVARGGARVRVAAGAGRADPPDRPGHRARHVQPAPRRAARRRDRRALVRAPEPARRATRRSSCTTARCRSRPASASSTATRVQAPDALVLWEAQFGDFVNSAQVIVDQFLVSGLAKWGQTRASRCCCRTATRARGPSTRAARLERFLQLAAEGNIRVANCTTPAQYFHLLRRQALVTKPRPLVVMTPKSLLRLPAAASHAGRTRRRQLQRVIDDPTLPGDARRRHRLVLCSGKVYYDIVAPRGAGRRRPHRRRPRRAALPVPRGRSCASCSRATRTSSASSGSRRSRATWARARSCGGAWPDPARAALVRLRRPPAARRARRGLLSRAQREQARIVRVALDFEKDRLDPDSSAQRPSM